MASEPIPVITALNQLQGSLDALVAGPRWAHLCDEFEKRFGHKPTHVVRAPGRVNLIGEHIDYALFGVFPAAVERDILIAVALARMPQPIQPYMHRILTDATMTKHSNPSEFRSLRWESYVKAGYYGVLNKFFTTPNDGNPLGFDMLVTGTVPAGSGLSSSAAMVVASTLSFLTINKRLSGLTKGELVEMCVLNEQRVGVNSGGMDQAASVIGQPQTPLYISFFPKLSAQPVTLPWKEDEAVFVIANSLKVSDKAVSAKTQYNLRVVETLVGALLLAKGLGVHVADGEKIRLREVVERWKPAPADSPDASLKSSLQSLLPEIERILNSTGKGPEGLTLSEMIAASGLSESDFHSTYLSWVEVEADRFHLYKRIKHVTEEALRVLEFRDSCLSPPADAITTLGRLMNSSQTSCAEQFECSCSELDDLVRVARESGAIGSRLTGAGWGGCTVSLVKAGEVESFMKKVKEGYAPYRDLDDEKLKEAMFATKPGAGACVFEL
ncbi:galactokinase [Rhizoctonia solani]|uniref:Galactokinase n=1 Tax=Rhizoctonia solani TaxID=456999 RepID=A0A8H8NT18_9AGAM|nr:galactokinase [Rhizoctonia solani]QRW17702.1 galactokinase [Rhizoctonia solani]